MGEISYPRYRWFVMLVMFTVIFVNAAFVMIIPAPLVGEIAEATGWQLGTVTAVTMLSFTFFVAAGCVVSAFLLDKIGVSKTFIIACLMSAAGAFLTPVLGVSLGGLVFIRLLEGLGAGFVMASPTRIASEWFPVEERGIVTGAQGTAVGLGISVGLLFSPAVFTATGSWVTALTLVGFFPVIGLILSVVLNFGPKPPLITTSSNSTVPADLEADNDFKLALKQPIFYIGIIIIAAFSYVQQGFNNLLTGYLAVASPVGLGLGAEVSGSISSTYSVAFTLGALSSGFIGRYIFKNRLKIGITVAFIVSGIFNLSILVPAVTSNRGALVFCMIVAGFFFAWCAPMVFAYLTQCYPNHIMGRVGGLTQGISTLGAPLGLAVVSITLNMTGGYVVSIISVGIMCLLGFVLTNFLNKPKVFEEKVV